MAGASFGSSCSLVNLAAPANDLEDGAGKDPIRLLQEPGKPETRVVPAILVLDDQARLHKVCPHLPSALH